LYAGFAISLVGHVLLLLWAYGLMQSTPQLVVPDEQPIEVALIDASELLRLRQGSLSATELEAKAKDTPKPETSIKEADKPKPVTGEVAPPPPPTESEPPKPDPIAEKLAATPPPEPAPGPTPEEQQKLAELAAKADAERKAEEQKIAEEAKKKLEEKKKAEERKKRIEEQRKKAELKKKEEEKNKKSLEQKMAELADKALLDKDPTKRGAPNSSTPPTKATDYTGPTAGANQGNDTVLSAREADLLASQIRAQLRQCWSLPAGGGGVELPVVLLTWRMRLDGSLDGEPQVLNPQSDTAFQVAMEAAVRAVKKCSPFNLPPDKYQFWGLIEEWKFIPSEM
jgi:colicin import membrane protein